VRRRNDVSRALSGKVQLSAETRRRVDIAVEQLKYRPNEVAQALRGRRSHSIGLILPYLYDPFFATCAHAVATVANERGYSVILTMTNGDPIRNMPRRNVCWNDTLTDSS
jgi:LacI family transcriptional regulator